MNHAALGLAALLATWLAEAPALAYRPFDGTDADVAGYGEFELELGPLGYLRTQRHNHFGPSQVLNLGFAKGWEFVVQGTELLPPMANPSARIALVNTGAFFKSVLRRGGLQGASGVSIAVEVGPWLPTVNDEPGIGFGASLILSEQGSLGSVHANIVGARTRAGNADSVFDVIVEGPRSWAIRPVAEALVDREWSTHVTFSALAGLIAQATPDFAFDAAGRVASTDGSPVVEARAGFTWAIGIWH